MDTRKEYRAAVRDMGKKEFTLLKMREYGFWPKGLPTPHERQKNEPDGDYQIRRALLTEFEKTASQIAALCEEKEHIEEKLRQLRRQYDQTWDIDRIRKDVAQQIMQESIERRAERKRQRELAKAKAREAWERHKAENIVYIGRGYSGGLSDKEIDEAKLHSLGMPAIRDDKDLAALLGLEYRQLRFLAYHRDVVVTDQYYRYTIPKRSGGERQIAAPKSALKHAQRMILERVLENITVSGHAHGFIKGRSVVSNAAAHNTRPELLINMDLEDFFPSVTFARVRGMFKSFGYSGYISSLLAMLCTYCERVPIEVKGRIRYVKTSDRILPQGSPASPMITNILCRRLDQRLMELASRHGFAYSRYADDMSFSKGGKTDADADADADAESVKKAVFAIQCVVNDEGFRINKKKTRYLGRNSRQSVTGIVINDGQPGVPKAWVKKLRAAVYNAGRQKASGGALPDKTVHEISGMASWLGAVNYNRYRKLIEEARAVIQKA